MSARDLAATALPTLDDLAPLLLQVLDEDEAMSAFQVLTGGGYRIVTAAALAALEKQAGERISRESGMALVEEAKRWERIAEDARAELANERDQVIREIAARDHWRKRHDEQEARAMRAEEALWEIGAEQDLPERIAAIVSAAAGADTHGYIEVEEGRP